MTIKTGFSVLNNYWNMCVQVENSQWLLFIQKQLSYACIKDSDAQLNIWKPTL